MTRRLGMERQQFIETYLERSEADSENPWQTRAAPCPFLKDNLCTIDEDRPAECSGYPYLYKPDFIFRTMGMIQRTFSCPIVYEVMEELKNSLGFLRTASQPHIKGGKRKTTAPAAYRTQDGKGTTTNSGTNPYGDHNQQVR